MRPEIGSKIGTRDLSIRRVFDGDSQFRTGLDGTPENRMHMGVVIPQLRNQCSNVGDFLSEIVHPKSMGFIPVFGKLNPDGIQSLDVDPYVMVKEANPYQANFKQAVKDLRLSRGITLKDVAGLLGLDLDTLHDYLYKPHSRPGRDPLKKLCALTGRPMSHFDDDPGAPPEGATEDSSEMDRFMLRVMGSDLSKLTDSQKQNALEVWRAIIRGYESPK